MGNKKQTVKKLNRTIEEKRHRNRIKSANHYRKNAERIRKKRMLRYWEKKKKMDNSRN
jgi:hypothetical protein